MNNKNKRKKYSYAKPMGYFNSRNTHGQGKSLSYSRDTMNAIDSNIKENIDLLENFEYTTEICKEGLSRTRNLYKRK